MTIEEIGKFSDPAVLILTSLAEADKHGYAIMLDVEKIAGVRLGPGTLYGAISRLEERGYIKSMPQDNRRKPYQITENGRGALSKYLETLTSIAQIGQKRLANK